MILDAIARCAEALRETGPREWIIAYSGGKDSTAALKIFLRAAKAVGRERDPISVVYCDTGVENPELDHFAKQCLRGLAMELPRDFPNSAVHVLSAPVQERFFVRIIGRGYAPPSNRFRWCTKGLRVLPVDRFLKTRHQEAVVVLGLRHGESAQRDRSLGVGAGDDPIWQRQREGTRRDLLLPIIDFGLEDVWVAAQGIEYPSSLDSFSLEELYRGASGECPTIRAPTSPPCASGRFGCWTCTVVRRDKSTESLIRSGKRKLQPFLEFRDWLQSFREERGLRWPVRRNGSPGPGPFTLEGRRRILNRLHLLEAEVDRELVSIEELECIYALWGQDLDAERKLGIA